MYDNGQLITLMDFDQVTDKYSWAKVIQLRIFAARLRAFVYEGMA